MPPASTGWQQPPGFSLMPPPASPSAPSASLSWPCVCSCRWARALLPTIPRLCSFRNTKGVTRRFCPSLHRPVHSAPGCNAVSDPDFQLSLTVNPSLFCPLRRPSNQPGSDTAAPGRAICSPPRPSCPPPSPSLWLGRPADRREWNPDSVDSAAEALLKPMRAGWGGGARTRHAGWFRCRAGGARLGVAPGALPLGRVSGISVPQ